MQGYKATTESYKVLIFSTLQSYTGYKKLLIKLRAIPLNIRSIEFCNFVTYINILILIINNYLIKQNDQHADNGQ